MKYCKKCKKNYSDNEKFCGDCGSKLSNFVDLGEKNRTYVKQPSEEIKSHIKEIKQEPKDASSKRAITGLVVVVLLALVFIQTNVSYQVSEPTQVQYPLSYRVIDASTVPRLSGLNWVTDGFVNIENTDTQPGTFIVNCNFRALKRTLTDNNRVYILPGEKKTAKCTVDTDFNEATELTYTINPGTKTVTEVKTVTKWRTVRLYQKILGLY